MPMARTHDSVALYAAAAQRSSIRVTCRSDGRVRVYCPTDANQVWALIPYHHESCLFAFLLAVSWNTGDTGPAAD